MSKRKIETIINKKIAPFKLNEQGKSNISQIQRKYSYDLLCECIDIGSSNYLQYDENGVVTEESVSIFLSKIGGIAYNKSLDPIEQEINHLKNKGKSKFSYWNNDIADKIIWDYVNVLKKFYDDEDLLNDLKNDSSKLIDHSENWSHWRNKMENWIKDVEGWKKNEVTIDQKGTILANALFMNLPSNIQLLCEQINSSYENNLYDCTAVMMRRLLEVLLIFSYKNNKIESEILDKNGLNHITLDKIIKNSEQNNVLGLSSNTRKNMSLIKELGNYSAHKIWYNCTKGDIEPHILKYRAIIEELFYKSGLKQ